MYKKDGIRIRVLDFLAAGFECKVELEEGGGKGGFGKGAIKPYCPRSFPFFV